ncbi:MAG TPA: transposase [Paludibaculum sp.]|jgi:transposase-like protein
MSAKNRVFSPEFRISIAKRIAAGESVSKVHHESGIKRSVLYRWCHAYSKEGEAGLQRAAGRPPGVPDPIRPGISETEQLQQQIALLERKVGQQAVHLDFFKRAFKRVKESNQKPGGAGATASTGRSGR